MDFKVSFPQEHPYKRAVPPDLRKLYDSVREYLPHPIQQFMFFSKYSRYRYDLGRREVWQETIDRLMAEIRRLSDNLLSNTVYDKLKVALLNGEIMPSMRLMAMAGPASQRDNAVIYNCSYLPVQSLEDFREALLLSMAGVGVGYSVERKFVDLLPPVSPQRNNVVVIRYTVPDTAEGWGEALYLGLTAWFNGYDIEYDLSDIRPAGSPLRTKGGRASGPEPLWRLLHKVREIVLSRQGDRLRPIDAHDIMTTIAESVFSGGVRRSAMLALFDMDDEEMLYAKYPDRIKGREQRYFANNSIVIPDGYTLTLKEVIDLFMIIHNSKAGEPGIVSRYSIRQTLPEGRDYREDMGVNPCGEVILRPYEFCNLSAVVIRPGDTREDILKKIELATILGTIQARADYFPYLRPVWKKNVEEERLLGVSLVGYADNVDVFSEDFLRQLRYRSQQVNQYYSALLGINPSKSWTSVKPSGNSSLLYYAAPGLHAWPYRYFIRNIRIFAHDPLFYVLRDSGVPMSPEVGQDEATADTWVIHFPMRAPEHALIRSEMGALEQLAHWESVKKNYTTHNPSVTITYREEEVPDIVRWLYEHQDIIGGLTFLPEADLQYEMMPYEEIDKETYERLEKQFPQIDYSLLYVYEREDSTDLAQELACFAGESCEI